MSLARRKDAGTALDRMLRLPKGRSAIDSARLRELSELRFMFQSRPGERITAVRSAVRRKLGSGTLVEALFPAYRAGRDLPVLKDFFLVRVRGLVPQALNVNPWDIAYALADQTKAVSVTPDLAVAAAVPGAGLPSPCTEPVSSPRPGLDWFLKAANVMAAWDVLSGLSIDRGGSVVVAQADTGVAPHVLLDSRIDYRNDADLLRPGELPVHREFDAGFSGLQPGDIPGHGTFGATVIAGRLDGATAFQGIAQDATVLPIRCTRNVVVPLFPYLLPRAIHYATDNGAHVLSIALGGPSISPPLHFALNNAVKNNVIVVAAAGQCVKFVVMPAALRNCIAAGGAKLNSTSGTLTSYEDFRDRMTLWGPSASGPKIAIAGPAKDISHGSPGGRNPAGLDTSVLGSNSGDILDQGTTFATAIIAGVAALWLKRHGHKSLLDRYRNWRSLQTVFKKILADCAARPPGWRANWGPGVVDASAVLNAPLPPGAPSLQPPSGFIQQHAGLDVMEWFEDLFQDFEPQAVRKAVERLLGSAPDWRAQLDRLAPELIERLQRNEEAARTFVETVQAEATANAAAAAQSAADAVKRIASDCSDRLRGAMGI